MFDLKTEVEEWSRYVAGQGCTSWSRKEEIIDHLYCEMEELRAKGLSEREAFLEAARRMGDSKERFDEYAKNRGFLDFGCYVAPNRNLGGGRYKGSQITLSSLAFFTLLYVVFFAGVIFATSKLLAGSGYLDKVSAVLYFLWLVPLLVIPSIFNYSRAECAYFRRALDTLRRR